MTPEQIEQAAQVVAYATDQLRTLELEHKADPGAIFAELLTRLIESEFKVQAVKTELDTANGMVASFRELINAIWGGSRPADADHAATLDRAETAQAALLQILNVPRRPAESPAGAGEETHYAGAQPDGAETEPPKGA